MIQCSDPSLEFSVLTYIMKLPKSLPGTRYDICGLQYA